MNEQIKELAKRAGFYVVDSKIFIPTVNEDITACSQKFAELIVRECAEIALREEHDAYECIKSHFGVE